MSDVLDNCQQCGRRMDGPGGYRCDHRRYGLWKPDRCPTCGSDDPKVQFSPCLETYPQDTDTFHQSDTESEEGT